MCQLEGIRFPAACVTDKNELPLGLGLVLQSVGAQGAQYPGVCRSAGCPSTLVSVGAQGAQYLGVSRSAGYPSTLVSL